MNPSTNPSSQLLEHETAQETRRRLDSMAQLLHQAARTVWARADEEGPASPLHCLGLGIYLAHGQAQLMLPEDPSGHDVHARHVQAAAGYEVLEDAAPDLGPDVDLADARTAVQLLTEVEELSRPLPLWRADLAHGSQLAVDLCDLIREAQHLGC